MPSFFYYKGDVVYYNFMTSVFIVLLISTLNMLTPLTLLTYFFWSDWYCFHSEVNESSVVEWFKLVNPYGIMPWCTWTYNRELWFLHQLNTNLKCFVMRQFKKKVKQVECRKQLLKLMYLNMFLQNLNTQEKLQPSLCLII